AARQSFDGLDRPPFAIEGEREAGEHGHAFHQHRAGAAFPELAAVLGAGEVQVLAQHFEQRLVRGEGNLLLLAVHAQREVNVLRRRSRHFATLARGAGARPRTRYSESASAISPTDCGPSGRYQRAVQLTAPSIARVTSAGSVCANSPRFIPSATRLRTARSYASRFSMTPLRIASGRTSTSRCAVAPSSSSSMQRTCAPITARSRPAQAPDAARASFTAARRRASVRSWQKSWISSFPLK